jgi:trk system potassium uptake protein TrkA
MKYIVFGLGYFGAELAVNLTRQGHEVIGIDNRMERVNDLKDSIAVAMEMDSTNPNAIKTLPLDDVDAAVVAIGEDVGSSILTLSILRNLGVKRIIGRATSPLHHNILKQIGIGEIVQPEEDSALAIATKLQIRNATKFMELDEENAIAELVVPDKYVGHTLESINLMYRFELRVIAMRLAPERAGLMGSILPGDYRTDYQPDPNRPIKPADYLVVAGRIRDIKRFIES